MSGRSPDQERLRGVLDVVNDAVILQDMTGSITYLNHRAEELYGRRSEDAVGLHISDLVDRGDRSRYRAMMELLHRHGAWSGRMINTDASGRQLYVDVRITVLQDHDGQPDAVFSMASDVTSRVELEERLARLQRLESVGELSGGVAHDFNNLLTVILGIGEQLAVDLRRDPAPERAELAELADLADQLVTAALRGSKLTDRLLSFARRQTLQPEVLDVAELIDAMDDLIRRSLTGSVEVQVVRGHEDTLVLADPVQLESAIVNLAVNARDAMPDGGRLRIETSVVHVDGTETQGPHALAAGDYVRIAVSDSGHGMPDRVRANAFDPFFTTKAPGRGTGLGLSMIHGFAQQSGGQVDIVRTGPDGTTVEIVLPRAGQHDESSADQTVRVVSGRDADEIEPAGTTILVVDDEDGIRAQTRRVLERAGHRVVEASDGRSALVRLREEPNLDLVITDLVMPGGVDGIAVADAVAEMRPDVPVMFMSGFAADALAGRSPSRPLLTKPFRRDELLDTVRWVLGQQPGTGVNR